MITSWTYIITKTHEATGTVISYGRGGWDMDRAATNLNAAIRRTDKKDGVTAWGAIVPDEEPEVTA